MALHSFCGILTLQVGVAMIAVVFWQTHVQGIKVFLLAFHFTYFFNIIASEQSDEDVEVIAMLTFVVNFFEFFGTASFPVYCLTISTFVVLLIFGGLIAFFSAYNESNSLCMAGVALTSLTTVIWVTISSLSFYNNAAILPYVCVNNRCPETFWLAPLKYRLGSKREKPEGNDTNYSDYPGSSAPPETNLENTEATEASDGTDSATESKQKRSVNSFQSVLPTIDSYIDYNEKKSLGKSDFKNIKKSCPGGNKKKRSEGPFSNVLPVIDYYIGDQENRSLGESSLKNIEKPYPELDEDVSFAIKTGGSSSDDVPSDRVITSGYVFGLPLVGAVVLFICNFFFFLFSILVLWSYGQELAWTNAYLQDIPEYVVG